MPKRNVSYIKPEDPSFLKKLKQEIGYKAGPTVETKLEKLPEQLDDADKLDEQPVVVVLKPGDLTAEEADLEKEKLELENQLKPADLNQKIIFRPTKKNNQELEENNSNKSYKSDKSDTTGRKTTDKISSKRVHTNNSKNKLLSFTFEDERTDEDS